MFSTQSLIILVGVFAMSSLQIQAEITTEYLTANGYNFTCTILKHGSFQTDQKSKQVMLLHGFPFDRHWWSPILEHWSALYDDDNLGVAPRNYETEPSTENSNLPESLHAVACDLRGYSPGASPDGIENYAVDALASDVLQLADAAGFHGKFDMIGHDHGAGIGWLVAAEAADRINSFVPMAVPHVALLSDALCGDKADQDQIVAANYIHQLALPNSATIHDEALYKTYTVFFGLNKTEVSPEQFQKWLWWYVALKEVVAFPPIVSDEQVEEYNGNSGFINIVRHNIPLPPNATCDTTAPKHVGKVEVPTLLVCGKDDIAILCDHPYTQEYDDSLLPEYGAVNFLCGHNFFLDGQCESKEETQEVMNTITRFVLVENRDDLGAPFGAGVHPTSSAAARHTSAAALFILVVCCYLSC